MTFQCNRSGPESSPQLSTTSAATCSSVTDPGLKAVRNLSLCVPPSSGSVTDPGLKAVRN